MRTALVVVDMLNDFVDGVLANSAANHIIEPIATLLESSRSNGDWQVVYANDAHYAGDVELQVFPPHAMAGTQGAAVIDELEPDTSDLIVPKRFYSAFTETDLDNILRRDRIERIVLVGQHTDCCIRHTSYDAFTKGYELIVCEDATTVFASDTDAQAEDRQQQALDYLQYYYRARLENSHAVG